MQVLNSKIVFILLKTDSLENHVCNVCGCFPVQKLIPKTWWILVNKPFTSNVTRMVECTRMVIIFTRVSQSYTFDMNKNRSQNYISKPILGSETISDNWQPFKNDECYLFHLNQSFCSEIFLFLSWLFGYLTKMAWWESYG